MFSLPCKYKRAEQYLSQTKIFMQIDEYNAR